ncbi:porin family protein [Alcanivorax sp. JB21]|uniref:porin family protein n=1 Tax=Alcanivorax limicola TaxID=2874102 RepID=UPI001CBD088F|nr:porin family protein [Alcanivorax limicola]MBZ2190498.1 porin family protein [Alcanivorax limicola]
MKHNYLKLLVAAVALGGSSVALAAGPYIGANYTQFQFEGEDTDNKLKPEGVTIRGGFEFNDFVGLEARGAMGVRSDERSNALGSVKYDLDHLYGGYLKLSAPVGEHVRPYVVGGYTEARGKVTVSSGVGSASRESDTVSDESYGAGVDLKLSDAVALNVEYMRYLDKSDYDLNGISVGFRSAF